MTAQASLPDPIRQIVILVVGARYDAAYEIYAHIAVAEREGMSAGAPRDDLRRPQAERPQRRGECRVSDLAYALVRGGTLPEPIYRLARDTFGQPQLNEMIYLVGLYAMVSTTLNGFNVPVPERE